MVGRMGPEFGFLPFCEGCSIAQLLSGFKVSYLVLRGLQGSSASWNGSFEAYNGSFRVKTRSVRGFTGGFCGLRTSVNSRGSSTRIGRARGDVIGRARRHRLRAVRDSDGPDGGGEIVSDNPAATGANAAGGTGSAGVCNEIGNAIGGVAVGLGAAEIAGECLGCIPGESSVRVIAKHIKAANGVVKGMKAATGVLEGLRMPAEDFLHGLGNGNGIVAGLKAAEIVVKSVKVSRGVATVVKAFNKRLRGKSTAGGGVKDGVVDRFQVLTVMVKKLKAPAAALKILKMSMSAGKGGGEIGISDLLNWNTLRKTYKLSKNALTVVEVVASLKGGVVSMVGKGLLCMRGAVDGFGVMIKAACLSKKMCVVVIKAVGLSKCALQAFLAVSAKQDASVVPQDRQEIVEAEVDGTAMAVPVYIEIRKVDFHCPPLILAGVQKNYSGGGHPDVFLSMAAFLMLGQHMNASAPSAVVPSSCCPCHHGTLPDLLSLAFPVQAQTGREPVICN